MKFENMFVETDSDSFVQNWSDSCGTIIDIDRRELEMVLFDDDGVHLFFKSGQSVTFIAPDGVDDWWEHAMDSCRIVRDTEREERS